MQSLATMNLHSSTRNQRVSWRVLALAAIGALLVAPVVAHAASGGNGGGNNNVLKVQEDWEVDIGTPNSSLGSPQLTFLISPDGTTTGYYAILTLNQRDGAVGGLQLTIWNGTNKVSTTTATNTSKLATTGEKIQWTTEMSFANNGSFQVDVIGLKSTTWGNSGTNSSAFPSAASASSPGFSDFNGYLSNLTSTAGGSGFASTDNSGIDFGNARVSKIILSAIRTYTGTGNNTKTTSQLGTAKTLYSYP